MKKPRAPAIVFGGGINGLGIARNLGREGVEVDCVVDGVDAVVFSKYCRKHFLIPRFREREDSVRLFLKEFSKRVGTRVVVFATDDISTLLLSKLQSDIKDDYYFLLPSLKVAEKLIIKRKFYESLAQSTIPHPRVSVPSANDDLTKASKELNYPIFIKPSISPSFYKVFRTKGFVANSASELIKYYDLASKHGIEVIFQEIVPGSDRRTFGVSGFFNRKSKPVALFAYHRLRAWPNMFGTSSLVESVPISEYSYLKETITRYLESISYFGVMESEFKQDPRDGKFKLLEVNARSWWQNSLPTKCGLNIILTAYLDATGEQIEYSEKYATGVRWINVPNDIRSSIFSGEIASRDWICSLKKVRDFAFFDVYDPLPLAANLLLEAKELLG